MKIFSVLKKTMDTVFVLFLVTVMIAVILISDSVINDVTPSLFGYTIYRMNGSSMEPKLFENEVILSKMIKSKNEIKKGDVVTVKRKHDSVTHTVIKAPYEKNGVYMIQTKGDANDTPDPPVYLSQVESEYVKTLSFFDTVMEVLLSPLGIAMFCLLVAYMIFDELHYRYKKTGDFYTPDSEKKKENFPAS